MRLILSLALLLACQAGLAAQERANPTGPTAEAAVAATEAHPVNARPLPTVATAEPSLASSQADAARTTPIFDREFVRHVAAMVIAGVLTAIILRAIF